MTQETQHNHQIPTDMKHYAKISYLLIVLTLGAIIFWGSFARLDSGAIAQGEIIPSSKSLTIQHKEGGIIRKIYIKDGDKITQGSPIIELENLIETSGFEIESIDKNSLEVLIKRLEAERDGRENFIAPLSPKYANQEQFQIFLLRKEGLKKDTEILTKRIEQTKDEIDGYTAEIKSFETILASANETLTTNQELYKGRFIDKRKLLESQNFVADLEGKIGKKKSEIAQAEQKITETNLQIARLKNQWRNELLEQLKVAKETLAKVEQKVKVATDRIEKSTIFAPADGVIHGLQFNTVGGVVRAGEDILQIIPKDQILVVEAKVMPDDIESVHIGLEAFVRISAYKQRSHNAVKGSVIELSADTFKDPQTGTSYYKAKIMIDQKLLTEIEKITLQPGMLAQVEIVTGERTPFEYMIQPFVDSFARSFKEE